MVNLEVGEPANEGRTSKRPRHENFLDLTGGSAFDWGFTLPLCISEPWFFERFLLVVPIEDAHCIKQVSSDARVKTWMKIVFSFFVCSRWPMSWLGEDLSPRMN